MASSGCFAEMEKSLMVFIRQHTHHIYYIDLTVRPKSSFVFVRSSKQQFDVQEHTSPSNAAQTRDDLQIKLSLAGVQRTFCLVNS